MSEQASTELLTDTVTLWQDHSHSTGYRPTLRMLVFPDGSKALELNVHGRVTRMPYTSPECRRCDYVEPPHSPESEGSEK